MATEPSARLDDFPAQDESTWLAAVAKALKGAPVDKLRTRLFDGIAIEPLYPRAVAAAPIVGRPPAQPWTVVQRIEHPDPEAANTLALADLGGGAGGLDLVFAAATAARPHGIAASEPADFDRLLAGIYPDLAGFRVDDGEATPATAAALSGAALRRGVARTALHLDLVFDPVGILAARGSLATPLDALLDTAAATAVDWERGASAGTVLEADGRWIHAAGGSDVQELAAVLASAVAYWRRLAAAGLPLAAAAARIGFTLVADHEQFRTIAKLRALRRLWARAQEAAGLTPVAARVHAETAWRSLGRVAPQVNLLRATIAAFAAGTGGADSVTVLPFTAAVGLPDGFARRLARNTQAILIEESNLARVADPGAGSGLVEAETEALAGAAWARFQAIEAQGGIVAALRTGRFQAEVAAIAAERGAAIARRRLPLTGTSEFPDPSERPVAVLDVAAAPPERAPAVETVTAMPARRLGEAFEALRAASDRHLAATGRRPRAFLANLGRIADFNARSTWMRNLFEAGGIETVTNDGFASLDAMVAAWRAAGTPLACLCSSDTVYAEGAAEAARALAAAGAGEILLAGRPADAPEEAGWRAAGVSGFVHAGLDVVATLGKVQARLGIAGAGGGNG